MNKLNMIVIALAFGGMTGVVYAAKAPEVAGSMLVASADAKDVQSAGAHPNEPGISGDPISGEKPGKPAGGAVQSAGPHPEEPGISGDPVSAEKPGKATGGSVEVGPADPRHPNPSVPPKQ